MARTALNAPAHRIAPRMPLGSGQGAPNQAPSLDFLGNGIQDSRLIWNSANSSTGAQIVGWYGQGFIKTCSQVPSTISTTNIAAAQTVASGTPMTLTAGTGITAVAAGGFFCLPSLNRIAAGALAIDGTPAYLSWGASDFTKVYSEAAGIARCVSITAAAGAAGGNFLVSGADWYGYPMSQLITSVANSTVNSAKAFKFITSVVPQFTDASFNYSVGTADIYGLALACSNFASILVYWNGILQTNTFGASGGTLTAAVTTSPATTTTGDVRGTWAVGTASNATKELDVFVYLTAVRANNASPAVGLFGVSQV